jgi:hypothetical protein
MKESFLTKIVRESDKSGYHTSRSDSNKHRTLKNRNEEVVAHVYGDGSVKGTNNGWVSEAFVGYKED